jgi:hypothetical protein
MGSIHFYIAIDRERAAADHERLFYTLETVAQTRLAR